MQTMAGQSAEHVDTAEIRWGRLSEVADMIPWRRTGRAHHYRNQVIGTHVGAVAILVPLIVLSFLSMMWSMSPGASATMRVLGMLVAIGLLVAVVFFAGVWILTQGSTKNRIVIAHLRHTAASGRHLASHLGEGDPPEGAVWVIDAGQSLYVSPRRVIVIDESQDLFLLIPTSHIAHLEALPLETMWTHPMGLSRGTAFGKLPAAFPPISSVHRMVGVGRDYRGCIRIGLRTPLNDVADGDAYVLILRGQSPRTLVPTSDIVAGARQALTPDGLATLLATSYHRAEKVDL